MKRMKKTYAGISGGIGIGGIYADRMWRND